MTLSDHQSFPGRYSESPKRHEPTRKPPSNGNDARSSRPPAALPRGEPTPEIPPLDPLPAAVSSHLDARGEVHMVDVGPKAITARRAVASGVVTMRPDTAARILSGDAAKGEVLATARIAGIQAAKRTSELIPLCHAIALTRVGVEIAVEAAGTATVTATAEAVDRTGVEMEALVAATVACLTIYDMLKGVDREMTIGEVMLLAKSGGRSGDWVRGSGT